MASKLSIGFVFDDSLDRFDGVQQYITTLGRWMDKDGHKVRYLVGETKHGHDVADKVYSLSKNISVAGNQNRLSIPLPANTGKIKQIIKDENFDVLHVQMPYNPLLSGRVISRMDDITGLVGTFHIYGASHIEKLGAKSLSITQRRSLKRFDKFLAVSNAAKSFAKETFSIDCSVSPNVVNIEPFAKGKSKEFLRGENGTITFLGRLVERKGCMHLLKAIQVLKARQKLDGVLIHICGDGPMREELEQYAEEHGLGANVIFHGFIDEDEKADYLASADIAIFPATGGESFGIVLIEAMATGQCVVLGGKNEGYETVLGDRPELLFDPKNHENLATKLLRIMKNKSKQKELIKWQNDHLKQYDVKHVGPKLIHHYKDAISSRT